MSMERLERLLNLTAALLGTGRALTAAEIQARIEDYPSDHQAFRAAFERDKRVLREMGIPIRRQTVDDDEGVPVEAYRIRPDEYALRDPGLEPDELGALHLAARAVHLDGTAGLEGLWKLGGVAPLPEADTDTVPDVHLPTDPRLATLFAATSDRCVVGFDYQGERREVEPHRLVTRNGRWYLVGFDRVRDAERRFRLDRIDGAVETGAPAAFDRRPELTGTVTAAAWEMGDEAPIDAVLRVDEALVPWATVQLGEVPRADGPDGSVDFTVRVTNRAAFRSFVVGFLERAEVVAPPELRDDLVGWLRTIALEGERPVEEATP